MVRSSQSTLDDIADVLREVVDVVAIKTSHRDTAVGSHVNVGLLRKSLGLRGGQTSEAG